MELEEHQLNDLDMIVLACGDEGVVLQFINKIDCITSFSNLNVSFVCLLFIRFMTIYFKCIMHVCIHFIFLEYANK